MKNTVPSVSADRLGLEGMTNGHVALKSHAHSQVDRTGLGHHTNLNTITGLCTAIQICQYTQPVSIAYYLSKQRSRQNQFGPSYQSKHRNRFGPSYINTNMSVHKTSFYRILFIKTRK